MRISVAMAAYNGELYIKEQLDSILAQLGEEDEVIVSDDNPGSEMSKLVWGTAKTDSRIRYIEGPQKGVVKNFENALKACSGDIIFLSDQDDVWLPDKVDSVLAEFKKGADLVLHDAAVTDGNLNITEPSFFAIRKSNVDYKSNLIKNTFVGCCMAFTKEVMNESLPFPEGLPMHDWWIALLAIKKRRKVVLLDKPFILWRRHGDNVTGGKTSAYQKIIWRLRILLSLAFPICAFGKDF